ncbi:uncharacterized protein LOC109791366 [Cajanus cajan]|uniref:uncharacterized protein LOC109791366 n=1 Tax=Cajanus cajan TaxID=3821 RepID=UPI00098D7E4A|nr:uncharacterized protein LOC109791366 [Cajanus cajan]
MKYIDHIVNSGRSGRYRGAPERSGFTPQSRCWSGADLCSGRVGGGAERPKSRNRGAISDLPFIKDSSKPNPSFRLSLSSSLAIVRAACSSDELRLRRTSIVDVPPAPMHLRLRRASRLFLSLIISLIMSQPISAGIETNLNSGPTPRTEMFKPTGDNIDVFWKWNSLKDKNNRKSVTCDFCLKTSTGGITRAKRHQLGIKGDVGACRKIPEDLKLEMKAAYESKKIASEVYMECVDENEEEDDIQAIARIKRPSSTSSEATSVSKRRGINVKGPLDLHFTRKAEESIKLNKGLWQTSLNDACNKEARARVIQYIARFFYRNGIAFNVARSKSFKLMVEAIGTYGPHLKPPSYHELRVPLLKKELEYTKGLLKGHEEERVKYGCSIMSDGWTDRKSRTLINFLVNSSMGTMFVKSVDASEYTKTGEKVFELLNSFVEEIGEKNVVQVVTDNGSNYVMAGKILQTVRPHLFWTPCAAHCLDLMLEDIGKIPKVKRVIQRGIKLVGYIYNHTLTLNTMRKYTNKVELVRHGVTRFATTFLTLQRLHKLKANLRRMFTSDEWLQSKGAKEPKGKKATEIVLMPTFWSDVVYALKAMGPIVRVLRLVDNEKKPAMGYIYEAMERAKERLSRSASSRYPSFRVGRSAPLSGIDYYDIDLIQNKNS